MRAGSLPSDFDTRPFTVGEARDAGVSARRLRASDLARPYRAVRTRSAPSTLVERCTAYAAAMPATQFFCSLTAAALHGLPTPPTTDERLHVASVAPINAPRGAGIVGHQLRAFPGDVTVLDGLRLSTIERAWCEVAAVVRFPDLVAAGDRILWRREPLGTRERLALAVDHHPGRRGKRNLDRALPMLTDAADSPQESRLRTMLCEFGIGGLEVNPEVECDGRRYFIDLALRRQRIAIEYHGDYHRDPEQWRRDLRRKSDLERIGWHVFEVTIADLADPADLARRLRTLAAP